jgi:hypothetical protein
MTKFTAAIEKSKIDIVPKTVVSMGGGSEHGSSVNAFEMLLSLLVSEKLGVKFDQGDKVESERVKEIRDSIMKSIEMNAVKKIEEPETKVPGEEI